jgi:hypothetical protein
MKLTHAFLTAPICCSVLSCTLAAQDARTAADGTRAAEIVSAELLKATRTTPVAPPRAEAKFDHIETKVIGPLVNPDGVGVQIGGLPTGGGFSLGPRYTRPDLLGGHLSTTTSLVGSTRKWYRGASSFDFTGLMQNHLEVTATGSYTNAASVPYYGEGAQSLRANQSDFRREFTTADLGTHLHLFDRKLTGGYTLGGLLVNVGPGDLSNWSSSDRLFTEANTPGLEHQTNFITGTSRVAADFTRPAFDSPKGLQLEAQDTQFWDQQQTTNASFHLLQTQATYYVPFLNGMRTLAFRARNETTFHGSGQQVPFYLQPTLGGPDDMRGFERYRYYDNGASLLSGEYRWSVAGSLELAIFGDGGNVYKRPGLIGLRDLRGDGGFGVRFKNKQQEIMRVDVGVSPEGAKVWFVFNNVFDKLSRVF